jgi:hypothetical protein
MNLSEKYPKLFDALEDKELELRHLLSVDENELDYDSEEFEFDVDEYNYILYVAEPVRNVLGEEKLMAFIQKLGDKKEVFENFFASEEDLYGVMSPKNADEIAACILETIEEVL